MTPCFFQSILAIHSLFTVTDHLTPTSYIVGRHQIYYWTTLSFIAVITVTPCFLAEHLEAGRLHYRGLRHLGAEELHHGEDQEGAGLYASAVPRGALHRLLQVRHSTMGIHYILSNYLY